MLVRPWHVGTIGNDDAAQQVQLSEAWPVTEIWVYGWRLMLLKYAKNGQGMVNDGSGMMW